MSFFSRFFKTSYQGHQKDIADLLKSIFGYIPNNMSYFVKALTHKSYAHSSEGKEQKKAANNERLEFLGDAVLDAAIAEFVYFKFGDASEGYLTKVKSKLVNRKTLSTLAGAIGLEKVLLYDDSRPINVYSLRGNAFEAVVGALYLDAGYEVTKKALLQNVFPRFLNVNEVLEQEIDFKSKLIIWCQRNKKNIEFNVLDSKITDGDPVHTLEVKLDGFAYGRGRAANKKSAEQLAAKETLILIGLIE